MGLIFDLSANCQISMQDPSIRETLQMISLHKTIYFYVVIILSFVLWIMFGNYLLYTKIPASFESYTNFSLEKPN